MDADRKQIAVKDRQRERKRKTWLRRRRQRQERHRQVMLADEWLQGLLRSKPR